VDYITVVADLLPDATFAANDTSIVEGQSVDLNHTGSSGNTPSTYQWDFGDLTANATTQNVTHQYLAAGTYTVILTIQDTDGDGDTVVMINYITVAADILPDATFSANVTSILAGNDVLFTHSGSNGNAPATYQWDFGDLTANSTDENPVHTYTVAGNYTVTLTIYDADADGDTLTLVDYIEVNGSAIPATTLVYIPAFAPNIVNGTTSFTFTVIYSGGGTTQTWFSLAGPTAWAWSLYTGAFTMNGLTNGTYTFSFCTWDDLGNNETLQTEDVVILSILIGLDIHRCNATGEGIASSRIRIYIDAVLQASDTFYTDAAGTHALVITDLFGLAVYTNTVVTGYANLTIPLILEMYFLRIENNCTSRFDYRAVFNDVSNTWPLVPGESQTVLLGRGVLEYQIKDPDGKTILQGALHITMDRSHVVNCPVVARQAFVLSEFECIFLWIILALIVIVLSMYMAKYRGARVKRRVMDMAEYVTKPGKLALHFRKHKMNRKPRGPLALKKAFERLERKITLAKYKHKSKHKPLVKNERIAKLKKKLFKPKPQKVKKRSLLKHKPKKWKPKKSVFKRKKPGKIERHYYAYAE